MRVTIRKFEREDIPKKVEWINNPENNQFLHYDLPLEIEKTERWFDANEGRKDRFDAIIEADGVPCGTIGLLSIDTKNLKAEYYIAMGETSLKGKGVSTKASILLLKYAFNILGLNRVYLYTETENIPAQKLFEKIGFIKEGCIRDDIMSHGKLADRIAYGITNSDFLLKYKRNQPTPIRKVFDSNNSIFIKREDMIPFSFGGNKARKAEYFFGEIDNGNYDCVVTYGSSSSNHCRIISNLSASRNLSCYIISPEEASHPTSNSKLMEMFGAKFTICPVSEVSKTIDKVLDNLKKQGHTPYFIPGGGHGNLGTQAYIDCYGEILDYEKSNNIDFDYIFFASGTGTTHAGLVCGKMINNKNHNIVGISIARKNPGGRNVVIESIKEYLDAKSITYVDQCIEENTVFVDDYTDEGYGKNNPEITNTIIKMMIEHGIPMDSTYVAKAYYGMKQYIKEMGIKGKDILFIHTGGTPLFFDDLSNI